MRRPSAATSRFVVRGVCGFIDKYRRRRQPARRRSSSTTTAPIRPRRSDRHGRPRRHGHDSWRDDRAAPIGVAARARPATSPRRSIWPLDPTLRRSDRDVLLARSRPRRLDVQAGSVRAGRRDRLRRRRHGHGLAEPAGHVDGVAARGGRRSAAATEASEARPGGDQGAAAELDGRLERLRRHRPDATGCRCAARRSRRRADQLRRAGRRVVRSSEPADADSRRRARDGHEPERQEAHVQASRTCRTTTYPGVR